MLPDIAPPTSDVPEWSATKRFGFRIAFTYLVLYHIEAFLGLLGPVFRVIGSPMGPRALYRIPWDRLAAWIGVHVFAADGALLVPVSGSTDSAIHFARTGCFLLTAISVAILWSAADGRREHIGLHRWWCDFLRFALAIDLFFYGVNKVIPVQMLPGRLFTTYLIQPFGDKSPAGLLWAFVGYSVPYQMFSGAAELAGALLLLSRRTAALGALASLAAVINVVALNLCYDVDLKLFTLNMLAAAIFVASPVLSTMWRLFVLRQPVEPPAALPFRRHLPTTMVRAVFMVLLAIYAYQTVVAACAEFTLQMQLPAATPLYGIYDVESLRRNGEDVPPLTTDHGRWRRVVMESPRVVRVQLMDDSLERYRAEFDRTARQLLLFKGVGNADPSATFQWSVTDADHLELDGRVGADAMVISLKRIDPSTFLLMNRGLHWIQPNSLIE